MEKAEVDFDEWVKNYKPDEVQYWAVYDPNTGEVSGIYPGRAADDKPYKIQIETFIAQHIQESVIQLNSCYVDPIQQEFVVAYNRPISKIDDVLHRIPNKQWSNNVENDVYIEYYKKEKKLNIALTERFYGTRPASYEFKTKLIEKNIFELLLIITDYNDPNMLNQIIKVKIEDLVGKEKTFYNLNLPDRFSIYTKRLFNNYIFEII
jgi:hypothetical protein